MFDLPIGTLMNFLRLSENMVILCRLRRPLLPVSFRLLIRPHLLNDVENMRN